MRNTKHIFIDYGTIKIREVDAQTKHVREKIGSDVINQALPISVISACRLSKYLSWNHALFLPFQILRLRTRKLQSKIFEENWNHWKVIIKRKWTKKLPSKKFANRSSHSRDWIYFFIKQINCKIEWSTRKLVWKREFFAKFVLTSHSLLHVKPA